MQSERAGGRHDRNVDRSRRSAPADRDWPRPEARAAAGAHESQTLKRDAYDECYRSIVAVWSDEGGASLDDIALMATINSVLANRFPHFFWTGFYRVLAGRLVIVPDVHAFPGHIACDPNSRSEIVVPVVGPDGELIAVLDVDSDQLDAFDEEDRAGLERIVSLFGT